MPRRTHLAPLVGLALVAVGCAGLLRTPSVAPEPTPPIAPDVVAWPELEWVAVDLPPEAGVIGRRIVALAAGPVGIVAVGIDDRGGSSDGLVLHAPDGAMFETVRGPVLAGLALEDVAAGADRFVAIGSELGDPFADRISRVAILVSEDGRAWQRVVDPAFDRALAGSIGAGPGGFLAGGTEDGEARLWRSPDGRAWQAVTAADIGLAGVEVGRFDGDAAGWVVTGTADGHPVVATSPDGRHWTIAPLPTSGLRDRTRPWVERAVVGRHGALAVGGEGHACGFLWFGGDCPGAAVTWWSDGSGPWAPLGPGARPAVDPGARIATAAERGFVAVSGRATAASADGLAWLELPGLGDDRVRVNDALAAGGWIVAVGEAWLADSSVMGWAGTLRPVGAGPLGVSP